MATNRPVLVVGATDKWAANLEWTNEGSPAMEALVAQYGKAEVEVETVADEVDGSAGYSRARVKMLLADFDLLSKGYIKDFHFRAVFPSEANRLVPTPALFTDDWLNDYADATGCADYHFLYCGGAGTGTHLHADVLGSYSWSSNVCGTKRWRFLPPQFTYFARDTFGRRLAPDFIPPQSQFEMSENAQGRGSLWSFPLLHRASARSTEILQERGDAIFVPSEWLHTVHNCTDTLSVNSNWFNRHSLRSCLHLTCANSYFTAAVIIGAERASFQSC